MALRIEKGIVAFKKNGSMIVFPDGNVGKDNEYLRFNKTPESKELAHLFASPQFLFEQVTKATELEVALGKLKDWINEHRYGEDEEVPEDINEIMNDVYYDY